MSFSPQKFREITFQMLFSLDLGDPQEEELISFLMQELAVSKKIIKEAYQKAKRIWEKRGELDKKIEAVSLEYALERIGKVERNVLRLGLFELSYEADLLPEVVIAESVRLTRKFSTAEAASFVNALIDTIHKDQKEPIPLDVALST